MLLLITIISCSKKERTDVSGEKNDTIQSNLEESKNNLSLEGIKKNNSQTNRETLLVLVKTYNNHNEWENLKKANKILEEFSLQERDTINLANSYYFFGNECLSNNKLDSSYYYYLKAEQLFLKRGETEILANVYLNKSTVQLAINDFLGAEFSASQALKFSRQNEDFLGQYDALTNLGIASNGTENYENAIQYYQRALKLAEDNNLNKNYFLKEISMNNIGNAYLSLKKYKQSIYEFENALTNNKLISLKPSLYATLLDNLAYAKFKQNENERLPNLFFESLRIRDSLKLDSKIIYSKIHLSEYYSQNKDSLKAQKFAKEALSLAKQINTSDDLLRSLKQLSLVEHKNASQYSKEYIKISDSLQLEERKSKDKFARIAFETDEIILEKDKLAEQNRNLLYFFVGTLLIGMLLFVIRNQRAKNRELLLIQAQQKANEEIYSLMISQQTTIEESRVKEKKRIAQELHDGVLGRLFGARLNLDSLNKFNDEESINNRYNYLAELKNIEQDIREISHDLNREKYVLINNFAAIVNNLLEEQKNSYKPKLSLDIDTNIKWEGIDNNIKINLYRILQESLQNINKYANASKIEVNLVKGNDFIMLKVSDDGVGFDISGKKRGIGLQNMQSRTNECAGNLNVKSKKGKGTVISVSIPI